jgi:ferredoxin-type protein NapH
MVAFLTFACLISLPAVAFAQERTGGGQRQQAAPDFIQVLLRPKFITMLVIAGLVLVLLLTRKINNKLKVPILLLSTFLYGISANLGLKLFSGFSMHPSPICAATKSILYGFRMPMIVTLAVILFLTLVGPKLFCGWVCPVGAIQELIAMLADKLKIRRKKLNFRLTQSIRVLIFIAFIFLSWTAIIHTVSNGQVVALSLYDYINAFHGYEMSLQPTFVDNLFHFLPFALTLIFAFVTYRPFCYIICPIGLITNVVEQIALFRVVKRKDACTDCQDCVSKSPCPATAEILKDSILKPDCFSCTVCTGSCSNNLLHFGLKNR